MVVEAEMEYFVLKTYAELRLKRLFKNAFIERTVIAFKGLQAWLKR